MAPVSRLYRASGGPRPPEADQIGFTSSRPGDALDG